MNAKAAAVCVYDVLRAAARGHVGVDHRLLHGILDHPEQAMPEVARFASEKREDDRVDLEDLLVDIFRELGPPKEALPFYIGAVRRKPEDVSDDVVEALIRIGAPAVEPLLKLHEELGEEQGADIAFLLARLGAHDNRVLKLLLERLDYDAADGAFCLGLYGDPAARPALEKAFDEIPEKDFELRREISYAIEQLGAPRGELGPAEFDIWKVYPETALPPFEVLSEAERIEMLGEASPELRAGAAHSFFGQALSATARVRLLEAAKNDPDPLVRGNAWECLGDALNEPGLREAMLAVLVDESRAVEERAGAAVGLAQAADKPEVRRAFRDLYLAGGRTRAKALEAMWRSFDSSFAEYFPPHLDDPDEEIVRQGIWGVGHLGLGAQAEKLQQYFDHDELRPDALFNYALAVPAEVSRGRMRHLLRRIEELAHLSQEETELVMVALDTRLEMQGLKPVFAAGDVEAEEPEPVARPAKVGRNDPCPCGSRKKYKKCCGA